MVTSCTRTRCPGTIRRISSPPPRYGGDVPAIVARGNRAGTQFHVEKSQRVGLAILANFLRWTP